MSVDVEYSNERIQAFDLDNILGLIPHQHHDLVRSLSAVDQFIQIFVNCTNMMETEVPGFEILHPIKVVLGEIIDQLQRRDQGDVNAVEESESEDKVHLLETQLATLKTKNENDVRDFEAELQILKNENKTMRQKIMELEESGVGVKKQIEEQNRDEIIRLQDLIVQKENEWEAEKTELKQRLTQAQEDHKVVASELEKRLEFLEEEKNAMDHSFANYKKQKESEIEVLQKEITEADKYYNALSEIKSVSHKENIPASVASVDGEHTDLNSTRTLSVSQSSHSSNTNLEDSLMIAPPPESGMELMAVENLIKILEKIYETSNKSVQALKVQKGLEKLLEEMRSQRLSLSNLIAAFKKIQLEPLKLPFNVHHMFLEELSRVAKSMEKANKKPLRK